MILAVLRLLKEREGSQEITSYTQLLLAEVLQMSLETIQLSSARGEKVQTD